MPFKVAIVGRPNVGKSTLFNRLLGRRAAIVHDLPGVTRDRHEEEADAAGYPYVLIDTAGFEEADDASLEGRMRLQTEKAIAEADAILFLMDVRAGVTPLDRSFAQLLRGAEKPLLLIANKAEGHKAGLAAYEGFQLGMGEPLTLSAEHGEGIGELKEWLASHISKHATPQKESDKSLSLAIVGRPNAGKSTLVNALLKEERLLTGPEAGITRDAIAVDYVYKGRNLQLIDTAGLRKKARIEEDLEQLSVAEALEAIRYAEVVILVVDATLGLDKQDFQIAEHVEREGRILLIALNKWDQIQKQDEMLDEMRYRLNKSLSQLKNVPLVAVSAIKNQNLPALMDEVFVLYDRWNKRLSTGALNRWLEEIIAHQSPPIVKGRRLKIRYMTQVKTRPPAFTVFVNIAKQFPDSYVKYLVNRLREDFDMDGIPLRFKLKSGQNPYRSKTG